MVALRLMCLLASCLAVGLSATSTAAAAKTEIIMIGDSTVMSYAPSLYPRTGYGQHLNEWFDASKVFVTNKAIGGRSSKSFFDEGRWEAVKNSSLSAGDYVFIEFGHNDQTKHATDPFSTYQHYLRVYIGDTLKAGAHPVLLTSVNRCTPLANGTFVNTLGDFPAAMRQLAAEHKLPLIDLNALTLAEFNRIGETNALEYFMVLAKGKYPGYPDGQTDRTHLQKKGALRMDEFIVQELKALKHPLSRYLVKKAQ